MFLLINIIDDVINGSTTNSKFCCRVVLAREGVHFTDAIVEGDSYIPACMANVRSTTFSRYLKNFFHFGMCV